MRISNCIQLFVILFIVISTAHKAINLKSRIRELFPIFRLINGIALQVELLENPRKSSEIVAEFLKIRSGDDILKLKGLDVENLEKNLNDIYSTIGQIPKISMDVLLLKRGFEALQLIIDNAQVITKNFTDNSNLIGTEIDNAKRSAAPSTNITGLIQQSIEHLKYIQNNEMIEGASYYHLSPLKEAVVKVHRQLEFLREYETNLGSLFKIQSWIRELKDLEVLANVSMAFGDNFQAISTLKSQLGALKSGIDSLKPVIDKQKSMPNLSGLSAIINDFTDKKKKNITLKLTIGFFGNPDNIPKMFEDLKTDALKVPLAQGRDLKSLEKSLGQLMSFHGKLAKAQKTWTVLTLDEEESLKIIMDLLSGHEVRDVSFESIQNCFNDNLKRPTALGADQLSIFFRLLETLDSQVDIWKQYLQSNHENIKTLNQKLAPIIDALNPIVNSNSPHSLQQQAWNAIRNTNEVVTRLTEFHEGMERLEENNPFETLKNVPRVLLEVIPKVFNSLNGTNVAGMIGCIQGASSTRFNLKDVISTFNFALSVQKIKGNTQKFEEIQKFVKEVMAMKQELIDIQSAVESRGRRTEEKSLASLKKSKNVLKDMGFGIQALQQLVKILEADDSVMVAVNAEEPLKSAVAAIPEARAVWTDENRNEMGVMIKELRTLEQTAGTLKKSRISEVWEVFSEARYVQGVSIDVKFCAKVSSKLAKNLDPKIRACSADFAAIGALDLNFAMHHVNLNRAIRVLPPLQRFFNDIIEPNMDMDHEHNTADFPSLLIGLMVGGIGAFLLVLIGGAIGFWLIRRYLHEKRKWKNRERHWIYEYLYVNQSSLNDLHQAVIHDRYASAQALIKQGCHVDLFEPFKILDTETFSPPLFHAVHLRKPKFVELLITSGADRKVRASNGMTAEEMLKRKMVEKGKTKELREIEAIFLKYEEKTFRPRIRDVMSLDQFKVSFSLFKRDEDKKTLSKFGMTMGKLVAIKDPSPKTTHWVCKTDKNGVLDVKDLYGVKNGDPFHLRGVQQCISFPTILLKLSWVHDCLKSKKNFHKDYDHRITKFKHNGKVYKTLDEWKKWTNNRAIPCLANVLVAYVAKDGDKYHCTSYMEELVVGLGGTYLKIKNLIRDSSKETAKPYWFPDMNCHWILYPKEEKEHFDEVMEKMKNKMTSEDMDTDFEIMTVEKFLNMLMSLNGFKELEVEKRKKKKKGTETKTKTGTTTTRGSTMNTPTSKSASKSKSKSLEH